VSHGVDVLGVDVFDERVVVVVDDQLRPRVWLRAVLCCTYTWDIAVFIPLTKFEYYLEK
jgi:hypothetical protein